MLKIAIIGANLSGLSCAYRLEKYGLKPTIFEKNGQVGKTNDTNLCTFRIFNNHLGDTLHYFKKKYGLRLNPIGTLNEILMNGPNKKTLARGKFGYIFKRGIDKTSLENQIASLLRTPIIFDTSVNALDIMNEFDYVVVATGENSTAKKLGVWSSTLSSYTRIAKILGKFRPTRMTMWFNVHYFKHCYAYILPSGSTTAVFSLVVNDITRTELDFYWRAFLEGIPFPYKIIQTIDHEFNCGNVASPQIDNIYFIGNAAGMTDSFLGLGMSRVVESGIAAADSIAQGLDYTKAIEPLIKDVQMLHEFRRAVNTFNNKDYNRLITLLGLPVIKQAVYRNPFFRISHISPLVKAYNRLKYSPDILS